MSSSPSRKSPYGLSPKKKVNIQLNNDEFETTLEKSFEIFDSDLEKSLWFNVRMAGKLPEKRSNHASFIYKHSLYVYGGIDFQEDSFSNMWALDLEKLKDLSSKSFELMTSPISWKLLQITGEYPNKISHHQAVLVGQYLYIIAGLIHFDNVPDFMYRIDLDEMKSEVVEFKSKSPLPRDEHTCVLYKHYIYMFGGYINGNPTNQLWRFNVQSHKWEEIQGKIIPQARVGHSSVVLNDYMYVFGGTPGDGTKLNDIWQFNFESNQWSIIKGHSPPIGRSGHSSVVFKGEMYVFGGMFGVLQECNEILKFNFKNCTWSLISPNILNPGPSKTFTLTSPKKKNAGNQDKLKSLNKTYIADSPTLNLSKFESKLNEQDSNSPKKKSAVKGSSPTKVVVKDAEKFLKENRLLTPTTAQMLNSGLLKNSDKGFELYYSLMKKRKAKASGSPGFGTSVALASNMGELQGMIQGRVPCARTGHSSVLYEDCILIFGGDRDKAANNDLFMFKFA